MISGKIVAETSSNDRDLSVREMTYAGEAGVGRARVAIILNADPEWKYCSG